MSIIFSDISYHYYNQPSLFECINFSVSSGKKVSIVGNNGTGKSTVLKLIAGNLKPSSGSIRCSSSPYYVPQQIETTNESISSALGVTDKIEALHAIYKGCDNPLFYEKLADDWDIESRCNSAFDYWGLQQFDLSTSIDSLSGGEKTKLCLAGIMIHKPGIILLDEPTNHLDLSTRQKLYDYIQTCRTTVVVVSHDITLLNLLDATYELSPKGFRLYGGNYHFYRTQKEIEDSALEQQLSSEQTALRMARKKAQEVRERQEKRSSQGERNKNQVPRIMRKGLKNSGERTASALRQKHTNIIQQTHLKINELRQKQQTRCELKINFENTSLHKGKLLIRADRLNFEYSKDVPLWRLPVNLEVYSGDRIHLIGDNGTGKTTLVKLLTGELQPVKGEIFRAEFSYIYLDQEYSKVNTSCSVSELTQKYNRRHMPDPEIKSHLHRALFPQEMWNKNCNTLSGGEKMRLYLCCLMISDNIPDLFILDEPTNNLDLSSLSILTHTIKDYRGTLLVISHDNNFTGKIGITKTIEIK